MNDAKARVLVLCASRPSGDYQASTYIRLMQPMTHPAISDLLDVRVVDVEEALTEAGDMLLVQRISIPDVDTARRLLRRCHDERMRCVFELDDDLLENPPDKWIGNSEMEARIAGAKEFAKHADALTVSTPVLVSRLDRIASGPVHLLPNALDDRLWIAGNDIRTKRMLPTLRGALDYFRHRISRRADRIRILYMGTLTHGANLTMLKEVFAKLRTRYGSLVVLDIIGVTTARDASNWYNTILPPRTAAANYPGFVRWLRELPPYDIGIAPLTQSAFNDGKSYLKYLDYAALGIAPAVSDCASYRKVVVNESTGLLVSNEIDAWVLALDRLICDTTFRQRIQLAAREDLVANHTLAAQAAHRRRLWLELLGR